MHKTTQDYLTPANIIICTKVLQNLDLAMEHVFNARIKHDNAMEQLPQPSENDVGEMVDQFMSNCQTSLFMMDGNGYRMLMTLFYNCLRNINRKDLAELVKSNKEEEEF